MSFCANCGAHIDEGVRFCGNCGAKAVEIPASFTPPAPVQAPISDVPQGMPYQAPASFTPPPPAPFPGQATAQPVIPGFDFSRIPLRHLCPNGHVSDGDDSTTSCPTCGYVFPVGGIIHIYRMGNFSGMAVGMGIYIDDTPCGHLGNKQSIRISVPYGPHKVHMTHTTTRACNDPIFDISPSCPYVCLKAHFAKAGFKIAVEPASPDSMPTV